MLEDRLYYDDLSEENYSYGKWVVFSVKGILSPCNDWCQSLRKVSMTSKIFQPSAIVPLISEMKWNLYARKFYWREFVSLLILVGCFLTEIFWLHYNEVNESTKRIAGNILHSVMALLLLEFIKIELRQMSYLWESNLIQRYCILFRKSWADCLHWKKNIRWWKIGLRKTIWGLVCLFLLARPRRIRGR